MRNTGGVLDYVLLYSVMAGKKKLKAALEKAAKIIAKNICPADSRDKNVHFLLVLILNVLKIYRIVFTISFC